jgi:uncharacterized membrane protein YhaH (DUF805 family)
MNYYLSVLKKYAVFSGRARRAEYWYFTLFNIIASLILGVVDAALGLAVGLGLVYSLAVLLPSLGVTIRRLHDIGKTGWWLLLPLVGVPVMFVEPTLGVVVVSIASIVLVVFAILAGQKGENKYGPDPIAAES